MWLLVVLISAALSLEYDGPREVVQSPKPMLFKQLDTFYAFQVSHSQCQGTAISLRNTDYVISVIRTSNVRFAMITDVKIEDCGSFNWVSCPKEANYCKFVDGSTLDELAMFAATFADGIPCLEEAYIYIYPYSTELPAVAYFVAQETSESCKPLVPSPCFSLRAARCRASEEENCGTLTCIKDHQMFRSYCAANLTFDLAVSICAENTLWVTSTTRDLDFTILVPPTKFNYFKWFLILLILILLGTCLCSMYYKYRLKQDGFAPFTPPGYCPTCLFPLPTYMEADLSSINNGMIPLQILRAAN